MGVLLGLVVVLFGGGYFARSVTGVRQSAWAGPRSSGMRQRTSSRGGSHGTAHRPLRQELRLMREKAHLDDWGKQRDHERTLAAKNGTPATAGAAATVTAPAGKSRVTTPLAGAWQRARSRQANGHAPVTVIPPAAQSRPSPPPQAPPASSPNGSPGRNTAVAANGNAVEQLVEGVNQIHAHAQAGGLHAKHGAVKAADEGCVRFAAMSNMLSRAMSEPGMNYGPEITEPIAKAGTHLQAAAMAFSEADAAMSSLENMTVGDLAQSSRQAPHHSELTENGSH